MKIGKAKVGSGGNKKYFKLGKGEGVVGTYRFLPPLGELADKGIWAVFYKIHYGYKNSEGRMKPFQSCEVVNRQSKMIEVEDAAKRRIDNLKAKYIDMKEALKGADGATAEKLQEGIEGLKKLLRQYNMENKWYMNAIDLNGDIGLAKIPHKAKQLLDAEIKALEAKGIDALGVENGRFFDIVRSGNGNTTQYSVRVRTETVNHPELGQVEKQVNHVLTDEIIGRLEAEAHLLYKLFKKPTAEQVARLVSEGTKAVDEILGVGQNGGATSGNSGSNGGGEVDGEELADDSEVDDLLEEAAKPAAKAATQAAPAAQKPVEQKSATVQQAAAAPAVAQKQVTEPVATPAANTATSGGVKIGKAAGAEGAQSASKTNVDAVGKMSSDEFLAFIENS